MLKDSFALQSVLTKANKIVNQVTKCDFPNLKFWVHKPKKK